MGQTINKQDGIMVKVSMSLNIIQHKHKVASSLRTHSPVGWPRCRRLRCWPGSTGPRPWRARSSGASRRGRPRSCRRGGRSSRSAPGPAGEEARLVTRSAALRDSDQAVQWLHASFYFSLRFLFKVTIRHQKKKIRRGKPHLGLRSCRSFSPAVSGPLCRLWLFGGLLFWRTASAPSRALIHRGWMRCV